MRNEVVLCNGFKIPAIIMGTFPDNGVVLERGVRTAYSAGYRMFDTSSVYQNEESLGNGLHFLRWTLRNKYLVETKICNKDQMDGTLPEAFRRSQKLLRTRINVLLIHWPCPKVFPDTWHYMEDLYFQNVVDAIGVCNFHQHHLEELAKTARIMPMINQVELHPLLSQKPLLEYCRKQHITMEAYTPLGRMNPKLMEHPTLLSLAKKYDRTIPQIVLRWDIQQGIVPIPKSMNPIRQKANIKIFDFSLTDDDMETIDAINCDCRFRYDPDHCDFSKL